jgi:hypothetical protein
MNETIPNNNRIYKDHSHFIIQIGLYGGSLIFAMIIGYQIGIQSSEALQPLPEIHIRTVPQDSIPVSTYEQQQRNSRLLMKGNNSSSMQNTEPVKEIENSVIVNQNSEKTSIVIASKNGTKYYYSHCSGINRIKPENRIYFEDEKEAQSFGLERAANCEPK